MVNHNQLEGTDAVSLEHLMATTELEDVLPEPIRVSIVEFLEVNVGSEAEPIMRRRAVPRTAEISTYVPMRVLHKMMASQERIKQIQMMGAKSLAKGDGPREGGQQQMLEWMTNQVLDVWRLTEPDMSADRLMDGLSFQKMFALFRIFFGDLLKNLNKSPVG